MMPEEDGAVIGGPAANPAGWRGDRSLWRDMVRFSDHWRSRANRGEVGIDVRDAALLSSIRLDGLRVSLVIGPSSRDNGSGGNAAMPTLGLIQLGSMLAAHGARVVTRDFMADPVLEDAERAALCDPRRLRARAAGAADPRLDALLDRCVRRVLADAPAVVGLSAAGDEALLRWLLFQRRLRRVRRDVRVVVGGCCSFASLPEAAAREFDFLVVGEGEVPLLLICSSVAKGWDPARIPGLYRPDLPEGMRCYPLSHHLDLLPPPSLEGVDLSQYHYRLYTGWRGVTVPYQFAVGCPHDCAYCNLAVKRRYKLRSVPLVIRDLEALQRDHGVEQFFFLNSAFNVDQRHCEELLSAMLAAKRPWRWSDCCRPARFGPGFFARMRRAGCEWLSWGLDTSSRRLDALYRKGVRREDFADLMRASHRAGIRNAVNIIIGLPHETDDDLAELLRFMDRLRRRIDVFFLLQYYFVPRSAIGLHPGRYRLALAAGGQGVDEVGGMSWGERRAWGRAALERARALAERINDQARERSRPLS